jgi:hypothetical protein
MTGAGPRIVARFAAAAGLAFEVWRAAHIFRVLVANGERRAQAVFARRPRCNYWLP